MAKRGRKEKDNWKKKRRQEYLEKKEFRYYIFCEGQATEPKYFQGFKRYIEDNPIYRDMVLIEIEGCQAETMRVIGKAEEYVRENKITKGQIWCVYDKDSFPSSDVNGVVQRAEVLNQKKYIRLSGYVWEDKNVRDNLYNSKNDKLVKNVTVRLKDKDGNIVNLKQKQEKQ